MFGHTRQMDQIVLKGKVKQISQTFPAEQLYWGHAKGIQEIIMEKKIY